MLEGYKPIVLLLLFLSNQMIAQNSTIECHCNVDKDGDGINDCFDKCPNTPNGATVDWHGCPKDTDGDGVPDYLDKQLITPTECQPSDEHGVALCPNRCDIGAADYILCGGLTMEKTTIYFPTNSILLTSETKELLRRFAEKMKQNPNFKIAVIGYDNAYTSYKGQQLAWDHVYVVIQFMTKDMGIDKERFIFQYGQSQISNLVYLRGAFSGEEGSFIQPPPFPGFSMVVKTKY